MRKILLTIQYDGTDFAGWQIQKNVRTVQGVVEDALAIINKGKPVALVGSSRTDAGVHANGACAHFVLDDECRIPAEHIPRTLNDILAFDKREGVSDIKILSAKEVSLDFHARHDAKGKRYVYRIYNAKEKSPFRRTQFYQIDKKLDVDAMRLAASYIEGTHDFKSFESSGSEVRENTVRTVFCIDITEVPESDSASRITVSVEGNGFLYNMVRIIVGTLVEVGLHKKAPDAIKKIIDAKDRGMAGHTAPPQGLYLDEVFY